MQTPERFGELKRAFNELLDLDTAQREVRLAELAARDAALAQELAGLLAAATSQEDEAAITRRARLPEFAGRRIGAFRLTARLGMGGMGDVFLAERVETDFQQQVALKLVRFAGLSGTLSRSLVRERRILAALQHPGIARLIDGGVTEDGQPWLALEYVAGVDIVRYADQQRLALEARLRLWLQVAAAVDYAHRHLVVHRDIKPANVLVDEEGKAKLLDFGVAALLDPDAAQSGGVQRGYTPAYASPEQIAGEAPTTATDVHALGLLLYELLSGRRAFVGSSDAEVLHAVVTAEPPPLRQAVLQADPQQRAERSAARGCSSEELQRRLGGELEIVVAKALRKAPEQRYAAVHEFADDVRRHLAGEAVHAMPPSRTYRLRKFLLRHRVASAIVLLAVLGVLSALAVALHQRVQAVDARARAETENALLTELLAGADPFNVFGSDLRVADMLDGAGRKLAQRTDLAPKLRARLLATVGDASLGLTRYDAALAAYDQALARPALLTSEEELRLRLRRAIVAHAREGGDAAAQEIDALWPRLVAASPALQGEALEWRAHLRREREDNEAALADIEAAMAIRRQLGTDDSPDGLALRLKRVDVLGRLNRHEQALAEAQALRETARKRGPDFDALALLAAEAHAGTLSRAGRADQAERELAALVPQAEQLYGGRGNRYAAVVVQAEAAARTRGRLREATQLSERAALLYGATLPDSVYQAFQFKVRGTSLRLIGEFADAVRELKRARALYAKLYGTDSRETMLLALHLAATQLEATLSPREWQAVDAAARTYLDSGDKTYRWLVHMIAAECALLVDRAPDARRYFEPARAEIAADAQARTGLRVRTLLLQAELAARERDAGTAQAAMVKAQALLREGGDELLTTAQWLALQVRLHENRETACAALPAAQQAWAVVDPEGIAWKTQRRRMPDCGAAPDNITR